MSGPEQETLPYPVLVEELEAALARATADAVVLRARIRVRDARIAELERQLEAPRADTAP